MLNKKKFLNAWFIFATDRCPSTAAMRIQATRLCAAEPFTLIRWVSLVVKVFLSNESPFGLENRSRDFMELNNNENRCLQASLNWMHWLRFKTVKIGSAAVSVCDSLGDSLSSFFGITTPKYQFEIDHFNMMKKLVSSIVSYRLVTS